MAVDLTNLGTASRNMPQPVPDTQATPMRLTRYGDETTVTAMPSKHPLSDEGSYFIATNPTPASVLAYNVQASFSDTVPFIYILNNDRPTNPWYKRIFLDYIKIIVTTAAASGVQAYYTIKLDAVPRAPSANMLAITPVSPNMDMNVPSMAAVYAQNNSAASTVTAASASARVVARGSFGGVGITADELVIVSGSPSVGSYPGLTGAQVACPGRKCSNSPPILIGPQQSLVVHLWFPSNAATGLSYELEMGWWER